MRDRSEEQILSRLLELENSEQAERRAELTGERFLTLIHDPETGRGYVIRHGTDETEGAEIPPDTEFWEYHDLNEASGAYDRLLAEAREVGELVEEDSEEDMGDSETDGAEMRDVYSASDDDLLIEGGKAEESDETEA